MAMSKRCFGFVLCVIVGVIIGAVVFVVIRLHQQNAGDANTDADADAEAKLIKSSKTSLDPKKALMMCEAIINGTEPSLGAFNHPDMFQAELGVHNIDVRVVSDQYTKDTYQKSSYWLTGDQFADRQAISVIRAQACQDKIPVIVIKLRPRAGITLSRNIQVWNHYQPKQILETWEDYDKRLNQYLNFLAPIPAIVILEPDLLMFAYDHNNLQYEWLNNKYKEEFFIRAQRVVKLMARSWVYIDAGNAAYLRVRENMEKMAKSLLRVDGLRGFSINTAHFFNTSYNNMMARRLHCLTGLHYITDTSRNGGPFSRQSTAGIEKCFFDPPRILRGLPPGWSWGIKLTPRQRRAASGGWDMSAGEGPRSSPTQHRQTHPPTTRSQTLQMTPQNHGAPPDPQQDPEGYNNYINSLRNGNNNNNNHNNVPAGNNNNFHNPPNGVFNFGAVQPPPNNNQPNNNNNNNINQHGNGVPSGASNSDLNLPNGRVPINVITPPTTTRTPVRIVALRSKEEALSILRAKVMVRGRCLMMEPVTVHDANVWIKAPGEADGRMYPWGTYHKCLLGHTRPCETECRLIMNTEYDERVEKCGCGQQNNNPTPQSSGNQGIFFPADSGNSNQASSHSNPNPGYSNPNTQGVNGGSAQEDPDIPSSYSSLSEILARGGGKR